MIFPGATTFNLAAGGLAGAVVALGLASAWNSWFENPRIRAETEAAVTAELTTNFFKATGELTNAADQARARRAFCIDAGKLYDIAAGDCKEN